MSYQFIDESAIAFFPPHPSNQGFTVGEEGFDVVLEKIELQEERGVRGKERGIPHAVFAGN